jgi:sarcosine oxidase subunit alpha
MSTTPTKLSALHHIHLSLRARMADQAGWQLAAVYSSAEQETDVVRKSVGLCDTSPLGKLDVRGTDAFAFLQEVYASGVPEAVGAMGRVAGEMGSAPDQSLCACLAGDHFYLITGATARDAILRGLNERLKRREREIHLIDLTSAFASITIAGPRRMDLLCKETGFNLSDFPDMACAQTGVAGVYARLLHSWNAYHIHVPREFGEYIWEVLMEAGEDFGIAPFGSETWAQMT